MKKLTAFLLCLAFLVSMLAGCSALPDDTPAAETAETEVPATPEPTPTPTPVPTPEPTPEPTPTVSHYSFQPKVCSVYMEELFGETMCETWFCLVDAVMAGEDSFACPDKHTYDWVMGQFPNKCFPVLTELIDYGYDRNNPVVDGMASFTYKVPKEEAAEKIAAFAALVEEILNEALEDDYSDFEKALALYKYFTDHYVYDYDAYYQMYDHYVSYLSSYRLLTTGTGVCAEISTAYSYLLMEAGVDATTMMGDRDYDRAGHEWSYIRLNGRDYHIDPTYAIGSWNTPLCYFLMDDEKRELEDGYRKVDFTITSNYAQDYPPPERPADDDRFRELWDGYYCRFDHETQTLYYWVYNDNYQAIEMEFDYSGY